MGLVERTLDSGLVLQEYGQDHASLERELKKRDPDLSLQGHFSDTHGCIIWKVILVRPDRPSETVYVWQSERGEPYPLSSGILAGLDRLDKNTRAVYLDENERNDQRAHDLARANERANEAIIDDTTFKHGRPLLPRSQSLRMSRDKQRAKGRKV